MLHYNELYQSLKKVSAEWHAGHVQWSYSWFYIKFFHDNTFIYASINGDNFDQINTWFDKEAENVTRGTFEEKSNGQITLNFDDASGILATLTNEGKLLVQGKLSWEIFSRID